MKNHQLNIRPAKIEDAPLILEFIKKLAEFEKRSHEVVATEMDLQNNLFGEKPKAEVIIGECENKPVTFALFYHNFSTFLGRPGIYLEDLFVQPSERGKGFGRVMLKELAKIAKERQCGRLEWSVLDWNEGAIRFYDSLGAKPLSEWITYRTTDSALEQLASEN